MEKVNRKVMEISGMTCMHCAKSVATILEKGGAEEINVDFLQNEAHFLLTDDAILPTIEKNIEQAGFSVKKSFWTLERELLIASIFTLPLFLSMFISVLETPWLQLCLVLPVMFIAVRKFSGAFLAIKSGTINMDVLVMIGVSAAFIYSLMGMFGFDIDGSYFETSGTIITLVLLGKWIESKAVSRTTSAVEALKKKQEVVARMLDGSLRPYEKLKIGDVIQVNHGDAVPADGKVVDGVALFDEALLTGESLPVSKSAGNTVVGGTMLVDGSVQVEITALGDNAVLGQLIGTLKQAVREKPSIQSAGDKVVSIFVPAVVLVAIITFGVWYFVFDAGMMAMVNAIAVLVVSCPCAMGLATPTAIMVGLGNAVKNGVLFSSSEAVETLTKIEKIYFDKTGTLSDDLTVNIVAEKESEAWSLAAGLELHSSHPIARAIIEAGKETEPTVFDAVNEQPGKGMRGELSGETYLFGSAKLMDAENVEHANNADSYLAKNGEIIASFSFEDKVAEGVVELFAFLKSKNIVPVILSGDRKEKVEKFANKLGVETYFAEQTPDQKMERLKRSAEVEIVAMVGDGINDGPALKVAHVGIAVNNASDVANSSADVMILHSIEGIKTAISLSDRITKVIKQNLFWAFAYNVVAIPIAAFGFLNPMVAALSMAFSDVIVVGNSLRLKRE